jgi:hypothetical protein
MNTRRFIAILGTVLVAASCSDQQSPVEVDRAVAEAPSAARQSSGLLSNLPVTGALAGGGTFEGLLSITNLALQNGQLVASGTLTGTATQAGVVTQITQTLTNIPLSLIGGARGQCAILNLDLGPLRLDLLGLVVDLSAIQLDIVAQSGPGKLLGNLLCALVGLLDNGGPLAGIQNLLNQINNLLGGL